MQISCIIAGISLYANQLHYVRINFMRFTKHRQVILATLQSHHKTLSASQIHTLIPTMDKVTIYRNLELFVSEGLIKKLNLGGNEATFEYQSHPHHHAVCTDCDSVVHFDIPDSVIKKYLNLPNFVISDIEVVVHGTCAHSTKK